MGDTKILYFEVGGQRVNAVVESARPVSEADVVGVDINWSNVHFFRPDGPRAVTWRNADDVPPTTDGSVGRAEGD